MAKLVASIAALCALAAGIIAHVAPVACVERAGIAFLVGWFGCSLWYVLFIGRLPVEPRAKR